MGEIFCDNNCFPYLCKKNKMSVKKFELHETHIKLLKHLSWSINGNLIVNVDDIENGGIPYGENTIHEAIDLIINGQRPEIDPFEEEEFIEYSDEEKEVFDKLYSELPTALDIILYTGKFEVGIYKTKYHLREWKKIN